MGNPTNRYCIAYIGTDAAGNMYAGNRDLFMDGKISNYKDIQEMQECIMHQDKLTHVAIINIMKYDL